MRREGNGHVVAVLVDGQCGGGAGARWVLEEKEQAGWWSCEGHVKAEMDCLMQDKDD